MSKNNYYEATSPKGVAGWTYLHAPDTKYKAEGVYRIDLVLSPSKATDKFIAGIRERGQASFDAAKKEFKKKNARKKFNYEVHDPITELEDGGYEITFKATASGTRKDGTEWTRTVPIFDTAGTPAPQGLRVGKGSTVRVAFYEKPFSMPATKIAGNSLKLSAVQVIHLEEIGSARDAEAYGFGEEEGGFSADEVTERYSDEEKAAEEEFPAEEWDEDADEDLEDDADF